MTLFSEGKLAHTLVYSVGKSSILKHTQLSLIHTLKLTRSLSITWGGEGVYIHFWHSYQVLLIVKDLYCSKELTLRPAIRARLYVHFDLTILPFSVPAVDLCFLHAYIS